MNSFKEKMLQNSNLGQTILVVGEMTTKQVFDLLATKEPDRKIFAGEKMTMEEVRELIHWLSFKPIEGESRVVVVQKADKLSVETSNALLKTLEEPPSYVKIILITLDEAKILPTIVSRALKIRLNFSLDFEKPVDYLDPHDLKLMNYAERFKWVSGQIVLIEKEEKELEREKFSIAEKIILLWQSYYRQKMLQGENVLEILKDLEQARDLLLTNISLKLLLENLVIKF